MFNRFEANFSWKRGLSLVNEVSSIWFVGLGIMRHVLRAPFGDIVRVVISREVNMALDQGKYDMNQRGVQEICHGRQQRRCSVTLNARTYLTTYFVSFVYSKRTFVSQGKYDMKRRKVQEICHGR